jgi:hypothetical protein
MRRPLFFVGLHQPSDAHLFDRSMISINRLEHRKSDFSVNDWLLDSGAFTRIKTGRGHLEADEYAAHILRWSACGNLLAAVTQDWMCEPFILNITGLTIKHHQELTTARFEALQGLLGGLVYLMPVLQGYAPEEYVEYVEAYGSLLQDGAWTGVGSVCKRNSSPSEIVAVLEAIRHVRPDLRLHGFGIKTTALASARVNHSLFSCDSMAWSLAARFAGRNGNDPNEAMQFIKMLQTQIVQQEFDLID